MYFQHISHPNIKAIDSTVVKHVTKWPSGVADYQSMPWHQQISIRRSRRLNHCTTTSVVDHCDTNSVWNQQETHNVVKNNGSDFRQCCRHVGTLYLDGWSDASSVQLQDSRWHRCIVLWFVLGTETRPRCSHCLTSLQFPSLYPSLTLSSSVYSIHLSISHKHQQSLHQSPRYGR